MYARKETEMDKEKKVKVTISLSESVLLSIDTHARIQGMSRSAYITKLKLMKIIGLVCIWKNISMNKKSCLYRSYALGK